MQRFIWAALVFYAQFIAIIIVAAVLGVPAVRNSTEVNYAKNNSTVNEVDYMIGLIYLDHVD